jgi:hypothetical protein
MAVTMASVRFICFSSFQSGNEPAGSRGKRVAARLVPAEMRSFREALQAGMGAVKLRIRLLALM